MFRTHLDQCKFVEETTSWIEILNYSVSKGTDMSPEWGRGGGGLGKAGYGENGRGNKFGVTYMEGGKTREWMFVSVGDLSQ